MLSFVYALYYLYLFSFSFFPYEVKIHLPYGGMPRLRVSWERGTESEEKVQYMKSVRGETFKSDISMSSINAATTVVHILFPMCAHSAFNDFPVTVFPRHLLSQRYRRWGWPLQGNVLWQGTVLRTRVARVPRVCHYSAGPNHVLLQHARVRRPMAHPVQLS